MTRSAKTGLGYEGVADASGEVLHWQLENIRQGKKCRRQGNLGIGWLLGVEIPDATGREQFSVMGSSLSPVWPPRSSPSHRRTGCDAGFSAS